MKNKKKLSDAVFKIEATGPIAENLNEVQKIGYKQGFIQVVRNIVKNKPEWSVSEIAEMLEVDDEIIENIKNKYRIKESLKEYDEELLSEGEKKGAMRVLTRQVKKHMENKKSDEFILEALDISLEQLKKLKGELYQKRDSE
jgi:non-canonical (house-cleaning) NTP pyrophosphatase